MFNFIELKRKRDIRIAGGGTIDGSGPVWWRIPGLSERPRLLHSEQVQNVSVQGLMLRNSPDMTMVFNSPCSNVAIDGVTIANFAVANTDGIDFGCDGGWIRNTTVENGDDSICMKSGAKNVLIEGCTVRNGPQFPDSLYPGLAGGLVLGTSDQDSMRNVTFRNCTAEGALAGIRIKFRSTQMGSVSGVVFEDIRVLRPAAYAVDLDLQTDHAYHPDDRRGAGAVRVSNVTVRGLRGELGPVPRSSCRGAGAVCPRAVARFLCSPQNPCSNLVLSDFQVTGYNPTPEYPVPCTFTNATGGGDVVYPRECTPPDVVQ